RPGPPGKQISQEGGDKVGLVVIAHDVGRRAAAQRAGNGASQQLGPDGGNRLIVVTVAVQPEAYVQLADAVDSAVVLCRARPAPGQRLGQPLPDDTIQAALRVPLRGRPAGGVGLEEVAGTDVVDT